MARQLDEFNQVVKAIHAAGFETGVVHAAGSYALMCYDFARMDAVRDWHCPAGPLPPH